MNTQEMIKEIKYENVSVLLDLDGVQISSLDFFYKFLPSNSELLSFSIYVDDSDYEASYTYIRLEYLHTRSKFKWGLYLDDKGPIDNRSFKTVKAAKEHLDENKHFGTLLEVKANW